MFRYILISLLIILTISLIYWLFYSDNDKKRRKKSEDCLLESSGTFDEGARRALEELTRIDNPNADDYFRRGHIIQYNILEGNLQGRGLRGTARQHRRAAVGHIVRDYTDALTDMHVDAGADRNLNPEFMVYRIDDFGRALMDDEDDIIAQLVFGLNNTVAMRAPAIREEIAENRRDAAIAAANNRAEAVAIALDTATKFTDDRQNVHDPKVNNDLRKTLRKFKSTAPYDINPGEAINEAEEYIAAHFARDPANSAKIKNAITILNQIKRGETISTFGETEDRIFAYTWARCEHSRNREKAELMREAIINALSDGVENNIPVCINGRCARVLNSLVMLDYDIEVSSGALTYEAYRNQIFQELKIIVNREIDRAKNSSDEDLRKVGEAYESGDEAHSETLDSEFKSGLKNEINILVDSYADKLNEMERQNIKSECYIYALI